MRSFPEPVVRLYIYTFAGNGFLLLNNELIDSESPSDKQLAKAIKLAGEGARLVIEVEEHDRLAATDGFEP
jgi:hypothetical protein